MSNDILKNSDKDNQIEVIRTGTQQEKDILEQIQGGARPDPECEPFNCEGYSCSTYHDCSNFNCYKFNDGGDDSSDDDDGDQDTGDECGHKGIR
ncbi:MAG: hypothetical protein LUF85_02240 [Bacteroides sp.]|nr:hypothetical protein [Bacteroides sp.]